MDTGTFYEMPQPKPKKKGSMGIGILLGIIIGCVSSLLLTFGVIKVYTLLSGNYVVFGAHEVDTAESHSRVVNKETIDKVEELIAYMDLYYYEDYDITDIQEAIYGGTLEGLGDPYSVYYTKDEYQDLQLTTTGTYHGIGAGLSQDPKTMEVTVIKVYAGTPSEDAGMLNGDKILMVDDIEATSMELNQLVKNIRGEEGSTVHNPH